MKHLAYTIPLALSLTSWIGSYFTHTFEGHRDLVILSAFCLGIGITNVFKMIKWR